MNYKSINDALFFIYPWIIMRNIEVLEISNPFLHTQFIESFLIREEL